MPSAEQLRSRLLKKLRELFQLDQPDLDFGFYRIMHAKTRQVQEFIEKDLLKIAANAFDQPNDVYETELQATYQKSLQFAGESGMVNSEDINVIEQPGKIFDTIIEATSSEGDIYDHLYRFFERYYDNGDFISRRYYTRETSGKAAPFAIPYNGEEVKLVWANMDQYYIKTEEYFSNYTFDLMQAKEIRALNDGLFSIETNVKKTCKVHFKIVGATEGEHNNIKASEADKRFFIIHAENPIDITENNELTINFEYRPDPQKFGQDTAWRDRRNSEATEVILEKLKEIARKDKTLTIYLRLLKTPAPTEKDKNRPLLAKYINQYTARNTMDYFIHKDLGGFLRRELDFYIKNEVMRLDDIENADAPAIEAYLTKIKVLRKIACKLIDFLSQLENFQKKLWLKKKFVIETHYCITLDRVPEELYPEIASNKDQHDEWVQLFAIDEIEPDLARPVYTKPLTVEFLKANNKLILDTRFFDEAFKARLLAHIDNFDDQCNGLLIHSENFQALNLLQKKYKKWIKCIYIDPPYNTASTPILYKNEYRHSSWISFVWDRLYISQPLMEICGVKSIAIDDTEMVNLSKILENIGSLTNFVV